MYVRSFSYDYDYVDQKRLYDYVFWRFHYDVSDINALMTMIMIVISLVEASPNSTAPPGTTLC